jgi:hypothetical protein
MRNCWMLVSALLVLGTLAAVSPTQADIASGLVAYYPFNGNANDASGNGNNGTVVGAVFTNGPSGEGALRFAGDSSTYVVVPRSASLEPTDGLSISMWCYGVPGQPCGYGWGTILRKEDNCAAGYFIRGCNSGPGFEIRNRNACSAGGVVSASFLPFTGTNWQHIVGTYSVTDGMLRTYENGVLVSQTPYGSPLEHSGDLYIGGATVAPDDGGFNGLISEVRIYNRALSATDVGDLEGNVSGCTGCIGPQGPAGPQGPTGATGPQGPAGVGVVQGAIMSLPSGSPAPSGFTLLGTSTMKYRVGKKTTTIKVDVYKKN